MIAVEPRVVLSAAGGMLAGYLMWLVGGVIITATLPVSFWVAASVILLVAITAGALGFWRHKQGLLATALLWMPALPILASVYLLICIVR